MTYSLTTELAVVDTEAKMHSVLAKYEVDKVRIAYSGGADSDVVLALTQLAGYSLKSVFYNTGLEMQATLDHIENKRKEGHIIEVEKAVVPIPTAVRKYGYPFINKRVSDMLQRLQKHNFDFRGDGAKSFEALYLKYPRCKSALRWWTNNHNGKAANISWNQGLREFLTKQGLPFKVSNKCFRF